MEFDLTNEEQEDFELMRKIELTKQSRNKAIDEVLKLISDLIADCGQFEYDEKSLIYLKKEVEKLKDGI